MRVSQEQKERMRPFLESYPTNLMGIASEFGTIIFSTPLPNGVSGMLKRDPKFDTPSGFVIFVDSDEPPYRQRFTAAHELAHLMLHKDSIGDGIEDNYLLRAEGLSNRQEAEANALAADIVMPKILISEAMSAGMVTVDELAKAFKVSKIAMGIRLGLPT